jgi:hypothetical protein
VCLTVRTQNLAKHGLHPRFTHVLVNMPMLYGPLCFPAAVSAWRGLMQVVSSALPSPSYRVTSSSPPPPASHSAIPQKFRQEQVERMIASVVLCGLAGLSLAPHQEPRFLLPVAMPMCVLFGHKLFTRVHHERVVSVHCWFAFNILVAAFWGMFHQVPNIRDYFYDVCIDWFESDNIFSHMDARHRMLLSLVFLPLASSAHCIQNRMHARTLNIRNFRGCACFCAVIGRSHSCWSVAVVSNDGGS